jgi:hypothetical protein
VRLNLEPQSIAVMEDTPTNSARRRRPSIRARSLIIPPLPATICQYI